MKGWWPAGPATVMATAVLAAIGVGCGGSAGDDPPQSGGHESSARIDTSVTTDNSLTKPRYIAEINDFCRSRWRFILNAVRQTRVLWTKQYPRVDAMKNYVRSVRLSYFSSINYLIFNEVRRMEVPPGQERAIGEMIQVMQETIQRGERGEPVTSVAQLRALFAEYNRKARRYGLDECLAAGSHLPHPEI